jgi:hypothetical protein
MPCITANYNIFIFRSGVDGGWMMCSDDGRQITAIHWQFFYGTACLVRTTVRQKPTKYSVWFMSVMRASRLLRGVVMTSNEDDRPVPAFAVVVPDIEIDNFLTI